MSHKQDYAQGAAGGAWSLPEAAKAPSEQLSAAAAAPLSPVSRQPGGRRLIQAARRAAQPPPGRRSPGGPEGPTPGPQGRGQGRGDPGRDGRGATAARSSPRAPHPRRGARSGAEGGRHDPRPGGRGPGERKPPGPGHAPAAAGAPGGLPQPGRRAGPRAIAKARAAQRPGASEPQPGPPKARPGPGSRGPQPGPGPRRPPPEAAQPEGTGSRGGYGARIPLMFGGSAAHAKRAGPGGGPEARRDPEPHPSGYATAIMPAQRPLCRRLIGSGVRDLGGYYDTPPGVLCALCQRKSAEKNCSYWQI